MQEYRLRIDAISGVTDDTLTRFLRDKSDAFLLVHHQINDNPHYHAYVSTKYTQGNFSNLIKKIFPVKGDLYSNKKCDPSRNHEYFAYLFNTKKGNVPRYVDSEGISPLDVTQAQAHAQEVAKEFQARVSSAKKSKFDIAECVSENDWLNLEELYDNVVSALLVNRMCTSAFVVRDIMSTAIALSKNKSMKEEVKKSVCEYFRK